jgi:subtilisin family serine protease
MKKNLSFLFLSLFVGFISFAQTEPTDFTGRGLREREQAPQTDAMNFVPTEILVKFKDDVSLSTGTQLKSTGIKGIDQVLKSASIEKMEKLFPQAQKLKSAQVVKLPTGQEMTLPSLHNIYKITLPELKSNQPNPLNVHEYIRQLQEQPEVEYAEPNYIYSIGDFTPAGPEMTMLEAMEQSANDNIAENATGLIPNDPLYNSQWGIPACNIDDVWNTTTGDSTSIIAILDTGVDDEHPDLKKNIWKNKNEIPGNGKDDDGNGKIDDTWGWDFINNDNAPKDDNSHGTHVAGIAAAVGNNGIGISGVNWKAKIMAIKVFQSSGRGDAATIAQGITYAAENGATVLNMSFGSYAESTTMRLALANAYATAVLVAAAGNDALCIGPGFCPDRRVGMPMYPAAYSFVLGAEATQSNGKATFTNYDQDGPVFSNYPELLNYEIKSPGEAVLSTVPGGNYREFNGTSMATPLLSGAVALYRKVKPGDSQEMMFANLIHTTDKHFSLKKALSADPVPVLDIVSYELIDTLDGDRDGRPDAGETIQIEVKVRNTWGTADSVFTGIHFAEFEDTTTAVIEKNFGFIGAIGPYSTLSNAKNLIQLKIKPDVVHDRTIEFVLATWRRKNKEYLKQQNITIRVEHGTELKGVLEDTLRLTPDKFWLVSNSFKIGPTGILKLEAGTQLKIEKQISNLGQIISNGTKQRLVQISGPSTFSGGVVNFNYTLFTGFIIGGYSSAISIDKGIFNYCFFDDCFSLSGLFTGSTVYTFNNCTFNSIKTYNYTFWGYNYFNKCSFTNVESTQELIYPNIKAKHTIFNATSLKSLINDVMGSPNGLDSCSFLSDRVNVYQAPAGVSINQPKVFWGTNDSILIQRKIYDFWDISNLAIVRIHPIMNKPSTKSHACVWKIVVNEKDAQDEFKYLDPLGVGTHKFEVYFNRPMDIQYTPQVSMGVRFPYNQAAINEYGTWSSDSLVYTVYKTLGLTANNGLNRIKVIEGKDTEGFDLVPEEERFNVNVQTVASASAEFQATAGLGKVNLEWNNNDLADGLGFNMYRMEQVNDTVLTKPALINSTLITDTLYTDYSVVPNKKYYYYYKILRTNLEETDSSKVVAAIPFTAALGDANGDLSVNVLDVTTIVAYLLNQNPQPFIFEAADVNGDGQINVLDIVATVNKVLNPGKSAGVVEAGTVNLYLQNDTLFADASVPVGAIQFDITNVSGMEEIEKLKALQGFESGFSVKENTLRLIVYSLTGKTIPAGNRIPLLRMKKGSGITNMVMGDKTGSPLAVNYLSTGLWNLRELGNEVASLGQNYPNPFDKITTIPVMVNEPVDELVVRIINITGQEVAVLPLKNPVVGENLLHWQSVNHKGLLAYRLEILRDGKMAVVGVRKMIVQ